MISLIANQPLFATMAYKTRFNDIVNQPLFAILRSRNSAAEFHGTAGRRRLGGSTESEDRGA
jgi:hypothetical protein